MMTLHTRISTFSSEQEVVVLWRTGTKNKGAIKVDVRQYKEDATIIAELVAIRTLLYVQQVFDRAPSSGQGYRLVVSKGAIKKLAQGRSNKRHCLPFAEFLRARMEEADIVVSHDMEYMNSINIGEAKTISPDESHREKHDRIETPAMGQVYLTRHAVMQYQERISSGKPLNPWASLTQRLMNAELKQQEIPARILRHKTLKFGRADNIEAWSHPTSKFIYLVVNEDGRRTVVTVFERRAQHRA
jgi:hypothetical protein